MVEATDVRVVPIRGEGPTRAMASVTLGEEFVVHGIRVIEGEKGLFVTMPQRKDGEGNYRDIAHPVTSDMRSLLAHAVLEEYERAIERGDKPREKGSRQR